MELQFKPKDHKSSCKCNSSHHCQMVQKRRRFLSTTDNTYKCMMLFFISRLHYRTWIHNCPVFLNPLSIVLSQLKDLLCSELITRDVCSTWHRALQEKFQQNQPILGQLECVQYASQAHCASLGDSAGPVGGGARTPSQLSCHTACTFWNLVAAAKQKLYKNDCRYGARQTWISKACAISSSGVRGGRDPAMLDHDEADAPVSSPSSSVFLSFSRSFFLLFFCFPKRQEENKVVDVLLLQT